MNDKQHTLLIWAIRYALDELSPQEIGVLLKRDSQRELMLLKEEVLNMEVERNSRR